jgi:hypothetical protein
MYMRFAERNKWKTEIVSESLGDMGGYKEVIARIAGTDVYSRLKFESGGHRVQRVPATEAQGRIHTSACTVAVLPEADPIVDVVMYDDRMEPIPYHQPTDLVAITVETYTARRSYEIADEYRRRGVPVVMGGFQPTFVPDECAAHADSIFIGDAETATRRSRRENERSSIEHQPLRSPDPSPRLSPARHRNPSPRLAPPRRRCASSERFHPRSGTVSGRRFYRKCGRVPISGLAWSSQSR